MDQYAVIGNPIEHSLSPEIHTAFSNTTNQAMTYKSLCFETETLYPQIEELIDLGYKGINVTVPFKQLAWGLADQLSPRAKDAEAVNTLLFQEDGTIAGDNTDGIGLTRDLINNKNVLIKHRKVLVLGAGGAVRGILGPFIYQQPDLIVIANRTEQKAVDLVEHFQTFSELSTELRSCQYEALGKERFDLIINATSAGLSNEVPPIPEGLLGPNTVCYDMMYNISEDTAFKSWALKHGALGAYDGLGMLVEQAAESFFVWRGLRPDTLPVIQQLRST